MRDSKKKSKLKETAIVYLKYIAKVYDNMHLVLLTLLGFAYGTMLLQWGLSSRYIVGQPSPQHYINLHELQYTDEDAMTRLKALAEERLVAVVVKDGESRQDLNVGLQLLRNISNMTTGVPIKNFPAELFNILKKMPAEQRNELLSDVQKVGDTLVQPIRGELTTTPLSQRMWQEIDNLKITPDKANLVYQILDSLFTGAVKVDEQLTEEYKNQQGEKIPTIERKIEVGDTLVEKGQIITPEIARLLRSQGYIGQDFPVNTFLFGCTLILLLPFWFMIGVESSPPMRRSPPWFFISLVIGLSWVVEVLGDYFGVVALGSWMLIVCMFTLLPSILAICVALGGHFISTFLMVRISYGTMGLLLFLGIISSVIGYYILREMVSRRKIMQRVIVFGILFIGVDAVLRIVLGISYSWLISVTLFGLGVIISLIFVFSLSFIEGVMGIITPMRLREICHPSVPLLRKLQVEIPGTYQHALVLGSLAEIVSEELGIDGNLMKAGAYYHDIGKLRRPLYYVENQLGVGNIQDSLSPSLSALTIIAHVKEGLELAAEYGLPQEVIDFIAEHHGTTCLKYFYKKAISEGLNVSEDQFCYPGPKPKSKETALLMLLDSMEAAIRANSANISSPVDIEKVIDRVFEMKLSEDQLDDVDFTFKDIAKIKAVLLKAFQSMYHTRKIKELKSQQG